MADNLDISKCVWCHVWHPNENLDVTRLFKKITSAFSFGFLAVYSVGWNYSSNVNGKLIPELYELLAVISRAYCFYTHSIIFKYSNMSFIVKLFWISF